MPVRWPWRRGAVARVEPIGSALWEEALASCRVVRHLDDAGRLRLRSAVDAFLQRKQVTAAGGLRLTAPMRLEIALQACVPILELGIDSYDPWIEVIVYPDEFVVEHRYVDEDGVEHEGLEVRSGESWPGGPVVLSWADIDRAGDSLAYNVVLHEFAHKLDMLDGEADGMPPLHAGMSRDRWRAALEAARESLEAAVVRLEDRWGDADTPAAQADWAALPLDPYASEDAAEFFACASEAFFETPRDLQAHWPEVYRQLAEFYRQDPASGVPG
ncbi:MAG: zinc-dependent peptidase [Pseudomonadota bacterium]|jgi:Mlc titration factor MtfA (ptsG expression regulator)